MKKWLLFAAALAVALLVAELTSRLLIEPSTRVVRSPDERTPIRPHEIFGFTRAPGDFEGTHINRWGLRGPEIEREPRPGCERVLMLGGSTTYGNNVETSQSYPAVVSELLAERAPDRCVEVINAGLSGAHSYHHLLRFRHLYRGLRPDVVTVYVGWNDYATFLWLGGDWTPTTLETPSLQVESSALHRALFSASSLYRVGSSEAMQALFHRRVTRLASSRRVAQDLAAPTAALREHLSGLIDICREAGCEVLLVKFPQVLDDERLEEETRALASLELSPDMAQSLPLVGFSPSIPRLVADLYDELAEGESVSVVDCAAPFRAVPIARRLELFEDPVHPSAAGYRLIAECLAERLANRR